MQVPEDHRPQRMSAFLSHLASELWLLLKSATLLPRLPLGATSVKTCPPRIWQGTLLLFALVLRGVLLCVIGDIHSSGPAYSIFRPSEQATVKKSLARDPTENRASLTI